MSVHLQIYSARSPLLPSFLAACSGPASTRVRPRQR